MSSCIHLCIHTYTCRCIKCVYVCGTVLWYRHRMVPVANPRHSCSAACSKLLKKKDGLDRGCHESWDFGSGIRPQILYF